MLQIKVFTLPDQEADANEFLSKHRVEGQVVFNERIVFVPYNDGTYSIEQQIAEIDELLENNLRGRFNFETALEVIKYQLADLHTNQAGYDELEKARKETERNMDIHDFKRQFAERKRAELVAQLKG